MSRASRRTRWELAAGPGFSPADVPQVAAGFWWDPSAGVTNLGGTSFNWAERGGHTAADQVQTEVAKQPSLITNGGAKQWRFVTTVGTGGTGSRLMTAGNVTPGWTGNTYLGLWHRLQSPTANDSISGASTIFNNQLTGAGQRRVSFTHNGTTEIYSLSLSADGTALQTDTWDASVDYPNGGGADQPWHWLEWAFTAGVGVSLFVDFVTRAHTTTVINLASINNTTAPIAIGCNTNAAAVTSNNQDLGVLVYANGIPSLANRVRLANFRNPTGVLFT